MISVHGPVVAHLGGWRGDRLSLRTEGESFRVLADLGWTARGQFAPQRRIVARDDCVLVLEPQSGPVLEGPLRVRRFSLDGEEVDQKSDLVESDDADLVFQAEPLSRDRFKVARYGVDADGRPTVWAGELGIRVRRKPKALSGTPLRTGTVWWYPVRMEGLYHVEGSAVTRLKGEPAGVFLIRGKAVGAAPKGVWVDGVWRAFEGRRTRPAWRPPLGRSVAAVGETGLVLLRADGGELPVIDGPAARLPDGLYTDLIDLPEGPCAVADGEVPRLVPVQF